MCSKKRTSKFDGDVEFFGGFFIYTHRPQEERKKERMKKKRQLSAIHLGSQIQLVSYGSNFCSNSMSQDLSVNILGHYS